MTAPCLLQKATKSGNTELQNAGGKVPATYFDDKCVSLFKHMMSRGQPAVFVTEMIWFKLRWQLGVWWWLSATLLDVFVVATASSINLNLFMHWFAERTAESI